MKRSYGITLGVAAIIACLGAYNATVELPVMSARSAEKHVTMIAYHQWLVSPSTLVIDLWDVDGETAMVDVDRNLFDAAAALKDKTFGEVVLAYRGRTRFRIDGAEFHAIGQERGWQNPVYTIRTLQEHLTKADGSRAFETWTGGLLGILGKQMEDHAEFHAQWWMRDTLGLPPGGALPSSGSAPPPL